MKRFKQIPNDMSLNTGIKLNKYLGVLGVMPNPEDCEVGDFFLFPECYLGDTPVGGQLYCCEEVEDNLSKCPFCGGKASVIIDYSNNKLDCYSIECEECGARISSYSKEDVIEKWNRRV